MSTALALLSMAAIAGGVFFFLAGTVGLLRFPDSLSRLHALTKADNLGLGLIVLGLALRADGLLAAAKLVAVWLLVLFAAATVARVLGRTLSREDAAP
jgi:multicomponent Na+:H+ antiporter subunit G